jgi:WD40 repeat protein
MLTVLGGMAAQVREVSVDWPMHSSLPEHALLTRHNRRAAHRPCGYRVARGVQPDGKRIVTASWDKTARLWDAETRKQIGEALSHTNVVWSAAFSPDGKCIVTASVDKTARLWDAETRKQIGEPLTGHSEGVI